MSGLLDPGARGKKKKVPVLIFCFSTQNNGTDGETEAREQGKRKQKRELGPGSQKLQQSSEVIEGAGRGAGRGAPHPAPMRQARSLQPVFLLL